MLINGKPFKEIMREKLAPAKVIENREVNHGDIQIETKGNKKVISYHTEEGTKLTRLEYTNDILDRIFINEKLEFEY